MGILQKRKYTLLPSLYSFICIVLLSLCFLHSNAQNANTWTLEVNGTVREDGKRLAGAVVSLYNGSTLVNSITTTNNGKFDFQLQPNNDYMLTFTKPGYVTKRISVSTKNVPPDRAKYGFAPFSFDISIFKEIPGTNIDAILKKPLAKMKFDPTQDNGGDFAYDEDYTKSIQAQLDQIQQAEQDAAKKAKELDKKYAAAISDGDKAFRKKNYTDAKTAYTTASGLKPDEQYPKTQLAAINKALADQAQAQAAEAKYNAAIAKGDQAFKSKDYATAKTAYTTASSLKPNEKYPQSQLAAIAKAIADAAKQKQLDAQYNAAIAQGDKAFKSKDYPTAKTAYTTASGLKPDEKYPKDQLDSISQALADQAKQKALEDQYNKAIADGDKAFKAKDYDGAKKAYTTATGLKPSEQYPKTQLAAIAKALADQAKQKQLDANYQKAIVDGDKAFKAKDYATAKTAYTTASGLKPDEKYPKDQLDSISQALADQAKQKALEDQYNKAIADGDKAFKAKDYATAKTAYTTATGIKPDEKYPKTQLAAIDKAMADAAKQKQLDANYQKAIADGDKAFKAKDYTTAKTAYTTATGLKPDEKYPKDQLAAIDKALAALAAKQADAAKQKALDAKYQKAIADGDKAFKAKDYTTAKTAYTTATGLKPDEKYPKDQLAAIDKALAALASKQADAAKQKALDAKYQKAIADGDKAFKAKDYTTAKTAYTTATGLKPDKKYPKDQLAAIDKALAALASKQADAAKQKALDAKYQKAIADGDKAFKAKDYTTAKTAYTTATGLKPDEKYPKDQLAAIDKALAALASKQADAAKQKALDAKYQKAIADGDKAFKAKDYTTAKTAYTTATGLKPDEKYPKDQLAAIDKALAALASKQADAAKQKALDAKYQKAIADGDKAFKAKDYTTAKTAYTTATGLKPDEKYPKDQLAAIDKALAALASKQADAAKQKALDAKYQKAIADGDKAFKSKDYTTAKTAYTTATGLKPDEKYPKDQLAAIDKALAALASKQADAAKQKALDAKYQKAIADGDQAFKVKHYTIAKKAYNTASSLKPGEQYPKDQLNKIDKILAAIQKSQKDQLANDKRYKSAILQADNLFSQKQYKRALSDYKIASSIKPNESYPKNKIQQINSILSQMASASIKTPVKKPDTPATASTVVDTLAAKYPPGVTEEHFSLPGCEVTRRIVVIDNKGYIYTKKVWNWGGIYYFRGKLPITKAMYDSQSNLAKN